MAKTTEERVAEQAGLIRTLRGQVKMHERQITKLTKLVDKLMSK